MTRLLLVEDDALIGEMVRLNLEQQGYVVEWCTDGEQAVRRLLAAEHELVLLDVMLPGRTGYEIAREARAAGLTVPILMLTARSDTSSKVTGLDAGADDYLTKPFDMPELMARVRALLRRGASLPASPEPNPMQLGQFQVDLSSGAAETRLGPRTLDAGALRLLELLSRRRGQALDPPAIAAELSGAGLDSADPLTTPDGVRETITRLRDLFEPDPERPRHFVHVESGGYRFES